MSRTIKLVALQPIVFDGASVGEGASLEVTEAQAEQLVASGSAETVQAARARLAAAREGSEG